MRMVHYYLALAVLLVPALLLTLWTGIAGGGERHLAVGLFAAILCIATSTLLILFMIVTGRVLKAAMRSRPLGSGFLAELNRFFAEKRSYPLALLFALLAATTAVLGYGERIGVPSAVHVAGGLATVLAGLAMVPLGQRTLRENQRLLDRAARELDRLDRAGVAVDSAAGATEWAFGAAARWTIFAVSAWLPYLYWGLVVWRGSFREVPGAFLAGTAALSAAALVGAWRARR